jgi:hypothetical protein
MDAMMVVGQVGDYAKCLGKKFLISKVDFEKTCGSVDWVFWITCWVSSSFV